MKISASATVVLTIEVRAMGSYGEGWKLDDLHKQVVSEVKTAVMGQFHGVKIIGDPKVKVCTLEVDP